MDCKPDRITSAVDKPTWSTLNYNYKKLVSDHREATKINRVGSGMIEVRGKVEVLLYDVILSVDEPDE